MAICRRKYILKNFEKWAIGSIKDLGKNFLDNPILSKIVEANTLASVLSFLNRIEAVNTNCHQLQLLIIISQYDTDKSMNALHD